MNRMEALCRQYTSMSDADIQELLAVEKQMKLMASLSGADIFIDIPLEKDTALVVAHARPEQGGSVYSGDISGEYAYAEYEPAVFQTLETGLPVCDLRALTQEKQNVRQNTAPIRNTNNDIIAVLIREKDVSDSLRLERKYEKLAREHEAEMGAAFQNASDSLAVREMHHRIKNSLQLTASILNLQARNCRDENVRAMLKENVSRVLSISAIHDILLMNSGDMRHASMPVLLEQLRRNLIELCPPGKNIRFTVEAEEGELPSETASSVAMVINELVTNAFLHAFEGLDSGEVSVCYRHGILFHTVTVSDTGTGFPEGADADYGLGLNIVKSTVHDKLHGRMHIRSDHSGTTVSFDFKTE